ncbi:MAG: crossover junction endodeoxyribonuclease RuvC [Phycisphaerae bacterium]|nr:crossover junction endodeoxyribonuclease RuvC [Phycisphaerae bacterium]
MALSASQSDLAAASGHDDQLGVRVLGIDPGLQRTGYAVVDAHSDGIGGHRLVEAGVIRLTPRETLESRLVELERELLTILSGHQPKVLACEQLYAHYKHPRTAILMGHARGVIIAAAARGGLSIIAVPATQAKKLLTGSGHATKAQIQRAVQATLGLATLPEPNDVADAIAVALCGIQLRHRAKAEQTRREVRS